MRRSKKEQKAMKIKYYDGTKTIEVEADEGFASGYGEIRREEWRQEKRVMRHETKITLTQMEDENGYQAMGEYPDPLTEICEQEETAELRAKIGAALAALTDEQKQLVEFLKRGLGVREIARELGKHHSSVEEMRKRVQKIFSSFLK
jgi:DNA-directed RNA polymerase specialized sigma24 family protein